MKKAIKWTLLGILIAIPILLIVGCVAFFAPKSWYKTQSLEDYGRFIGRTSPLNGRIFPDRALLTEDNCVFHDEYVTDGSNHPEFLTYAFCSFSEDVYEAEITRLQELANEYTETAFERPAYVLRFEPKFIREYALVDEDAHTIHYISYYCPSFLKQVLWSVPEEDLLRPEAAGFEVPYNKEQAESYYKTKKSA